MICLDRFWSARRADFGTGVADLVRDLRWLSPRLIAKFPEPKDELLYLLLYLLYLPCNHTFIV